MQRTIAFLAVLLFATPAVLRADPTDDYVKARMNEFHLPGLSLAVVKDGKIVKAAGYGFANVERRTPVTPETVFKICSVSKQFIATGIMLLAEAGRLSVDDRASRYLSGTPPAWQPITIRQLLTHTAGLVRESPVFDPSKAQADAEVVAGAYREPLRFVPGSKWEYSNVGYYVLAEIITRVSGTPWTTFLNDKVFKPAGMTVTAPTTVMPTLANRALGYTGNDNQRVADDWIALRPSGAFLSTVLDLAKWDAMLYTSSVLRDETRRQMWTRVPLDGGTTYPYGFGWHVDTMLGRRAVWHGGGLPGFSAQLVRFIDDGVSIVVLANGNDVDLADIVFGMARFHLPLTTAAGVGRQDCLLPHCGLRAISFRH
jgi:CubicO group peptidase (beta-lactamase class C family)